MPSANKDRTTVSFHIDKKLYVLLKRCSAIENLPMSRIIDSVIRPYVEKYQFDTLEEWEKADELKRFLQSVEEEPEGPSEEEMIAAEAEALRTTLDKMEKARNEGKLTDEKYEYFKNHYIGELSKAEDEALENRRKKREEKIRKWQKVCKEFPIE
jgi:hypothetical protein